MLAIDWIFGRAQWYRVTVEYHELGLRRGRPGRKIVIPVKSRKRKRAERMALREVQRAHHRTQIFTASNAVLEEQEAAEEEGES